MDGLAEGESVTFEMVGGAGQCLMKSARCDGHVSVTRIGNSLELVFESNELNGVRFGGHHVYFGSAKYPSKKGKGGYTVAPGQFFCSGGADHADGDVRRTVLCTPARNCLDDAFWIIIHAQSMGCKATPEGNAVCQNAFG